MGISFKDYRLHLIFKGSHTIQNKIKLITFLPQLFICKKVIIINPTLIGIPCAI